MQELPDIEGIKTGPVLAAAMGSLITEGYTACS